MAMMDSFLEIADAASFTLAAGTAGSLTLTNVIDLGASGTDTWGSGDTIYPGQWGVKGPLVLNVQTVSTVTGAASATNCNLVIRLHGAATAASAAGTGAGKTLLASTGNITSATFKVGGTKLWQVAIPRTTLRFLSVSAYVSDDPIDIDLNAWIGHDAEFGHMD